MCLVDRDAVRMEVKLEILATDLSTVLDVVWSPDQKKKKHGIVEKYVHLPVNSL